MAITVDLPPEMVQAVQDYDLCRGKSIGQYLFDHLKADMERQEKARAAMSKLDALVKKTSKRLSGKPYVFNRADAYEPEMAYA